MPAPSGTPYERATIAPVSNTQPTPSPMPNATVRSRVRVGRSRKASVSRMYSRNSSGSPSAATVINAAGIRNVANVTSPSKTRMSTTRNGMRDRCGSCGNSELANDGNSRCSPGAAPYARIRNQDGPFPRRSGQIVTAEPAEFACGNIGLADRALHGGRGVLVGGAHAVTFCRIEDVAHEIIDVRRAEAGHQVVARRRRRPPRCRRGRRRGSPAAERPRRPCTEAD